ncbi:MULTISPECIES: hypothetical protein [unclassified Rhizobacter]|uniref:hypothetical protein n=1 Tax=unclassified Rhizobacter TaxID=2640088 RepID=UPI0006F9B1D3|nr:MULTISPECIES: hypothetical protein [unclassified Rhizobacter]KQU69094.1 hypothetical protein ASC88_28580 [Rhizobacter sp. Root29]KQW03898.1 hypothetical protein ASC98_26750 [Rhizobacter sp. Root1238]KRB21537.1 hypothetical protein ASE08_21425 [Rhizobacter sp. Root16D2]
MDTCLLTTGIPTTSCDAAFARLRTYLTQYGFKERREASDEEIDAYRGSLADGEARWQAFVESGLTHDVAESMRQPYRWFRAGGDIDIEGRLHVVHLFVHPTGAREAALSVLFDASIWDALHSDRDPVDKIVDEAVKKDFVSFLLLAVESFAPAAFGLKRVDDLSDLAAELSSADVVEWLAAPTFDVIRRWPFQLAGVRREAVQRREVEAQRSSGRLIETTSGYLVLDLIGGA